MKKVTIFFIIIAIVACTQTQKLATQTTNTTQGFVKTNGTQFEINGKPYCFIGANFWAGVNLGAVGKSGNRERLIRELDMMQQMGINNIRIMALTEGPDTEPYRIIPSNNNKGNLKEDLLVGLDFLLSEMQKRKMYAVVCLSNFWPWSGGFAQYQKWVGDITNIDYPMDTTKAQDWDLYMKNTAKFYSSARAIDLYKMSIAKIINRNNTITNIDYKNDATIMSWELCNEPRGMNNVKDYLAWIETSAAYIKQLDNNHLVTVGSEGLDEYAATNGTPFIATHSSKNIDYTCVHLWVQNWGWYNAKNHQATYTAATKKATDYLAQHIALAQQLNKPFVLEEFGIGRDTGSYDVNASVKIRDNYYEFIFTEIYKYAQQHKAAGANFWAWSGEGKPKKPACWWAAGDDFTGDPPHEQQGWYSVYNTDITTKKIIEKYATMMKQLQ